jgi:formylglycine-generating enzyme required for sulfatase activity
MTNVRDFAGRCGPVGTLARLLIGFGALALTACGSNNDSDKSAGSSGGSGGGVAVACTTTADPSELLSVPAGEFAMGCNEAVDKACDEDEKPQHTVMISAFSIERTEVSQAQYNACMLDGACDPPICEWECEHAEYPAWCVTSKHAQQYCAWAGRRLPTEAEWEKAARGPDGAVYPWGDGAPDCSFANMSGCGDSAKPVGSLEAGASPYGALDMAGNMVEMVADRYDEAYYAASPVADPRGPGEGKRYVGRGGGFKSETKWIRASKRDWYDDDDAAGSLGFRCAN